MFSGDAEKVVFGQAAHKETVCVELDEQHDDIKFGKCPIDPCNGLRDCSFLVRRVQSLGREEAVERHWIGEA